MGCVGCRGKVIPQAQIFSLLVSEQIEKAIAIVSAMVELHSCAHMLTWSLFEGRFGSYILTRDRRVQTENSNEALACGGNRRSSMKYVTYFSSHLSFFLGHLSQ